MSAFRTADSKGVFFILLRSCFGFAGRLEFIQTEDISGGGNAAGNTAELIVESPLTEKVMR